MSSGSFLRASLGSSVYVCVLCCVLCCSCHVWLFETPWTIACQAPLSIEFSRQEYWSGLPFPPPNAVVEPMSHYVFCIGRWVLYHWRHLGSLYSIMSSTNNDNLTSSFPVWIPFTSFSSLTAIARTSKTMLNKSGKSGLPCLVPNLRGNAFSFSPVSMMLAIGLYGLYVLRYVPFMFF